MSIFFDVKNSINITDVAMSYGIEVNKHNKAFCPFHNDGKTPNLSFKGQIYKCFSCNASGDVIDFVARLYSISPLQAAKKINDDFALGFDMDKPVNSATMRKINQKKQLEIIYKQWERDKYKTICEALSVYHRIERTTEPFSDEWCGAVRAIPINEYYLDILFSDDIKTKIQWFKEDMQKRGVANGQTNRSA